jgi:hypothetical protein
VDELPPNSIENHPLVTPLAVIAFQTQMIDGIPTRFALVQWRGLLPDDTSWERWDEFCRAHNLGDKVGFDGGSIDMIKPKKSPNIQGPIVEEGVQVVEEDTTRPKRITKAPSKLKDYVYVTQLADSDVSPEI